jgi:hypothetical protein
MKILERYDDSHTITVEGRGDGFIYLANMIKYIAQNGNGGHSFDTVVDPDSENKKSFGWDGDGSDYIKKVLLDDKEVE